MRPKIRLDELLVQKALAPILSKAQALILSGQVSINGQIMTKAGVAVSPDSDIQIRDLKPLKYVSRGGLKLEEALMHFKINTQDLICLDIGASTGGFTDCLLQFGAKFVYAVDVGYGQIHEKLRKDPRVRVLEKTNARYLTSSQLVSATLSCHSREGGNLDLKKDLDPRLRGGDEKVGPSLATIDVSFISLEKVLPALTRCLDQPFEILALVKPQFEADKGKAKQGVVKEESLRLETVRKIAEFAEQKLGLTVVGQIPCSTHGPKGNVEYFIHLKSP